MLYHSKYIKYKQKYLNLLKNSKRNLTNFNLSGGAHQNKKIKRNLKRNNNLNQCLNIKDLNIPDTYPPNSPLLLTNELMGEDEEYKEITDKLHPNNSKIIINDDIKKGKFYFEDKDGTYQVEGIPFMTFDLGNYIVYYSWQKSNFSNIPFFTKQIALLKYQYDNFIKDIDYLNFPCIKYSPEDNDINNIAFDIESICKLLLRGKGTFQMLFPKNVENNEEIKEILMVTNIKKIDKIKK